MRYFAMLPSCSGNSPGSPWKEAEHSEVLYDIPGTTIAVDRAPGRPRSRRLDAPSSASGSAVVPGGPGTGSPGAIVTASFTPIESDAEIPEGMIPWRPDSGFDSVELAKGQAIEMEKEVNPERAKDKAKDNLEKDPEYYSKMGR